MGYDRRGHHGVGRARGIASHLIHAATGRRPHRTWGSLVALCALFVAGCAEGRSEPAPAGDAADARSGSEQVDRRMALTFDDLPANSFLSTTEAFEAVTTPLLESLERHEIPAIGFVNEAKLYQDGTLVLRRVATLQAWVDAGLELGNHTFSHPNMNVTPLADFQAEVIAGEEVTRPMLAEAGAEPRYFRHPFLRTGASLEDRDAFEAFLAEHGYRVAPVTIDNQEWIYARAYDHALARDDRALADRIGADYVVYMDSITGYYEAQSRALLGYELPQIMLLHANQLNADVMDALVAALENRGYDFVPLEEALEDPAYESEDEWVGDVGITWLHRWALTQGKRGDFFAGEPGVPDFVQAAFDDRPPR